MPRRARKAAVGRRHQHKRRVVVPAPGGPPRYGRLGGWVPAELAAFAGRSGRDGGRYAAAAISRYFQPPRPSRGLFATLARWALILVIWAAICLALAATWFMTDLPDVSRLNSFARRPQITLLNRAGAEISTYGDVYGAWVRPEQLPGHVTKAILAIEDRRFFDHWGLDPVGLGRAAWVNLQSGRVVQGGSTLTQQLAKVAFLTSERSFKRKMQEALLALWLESTYSKNEILGLFMNRVYFGTSAYGIDAAARRYFGVPASRLNLYQAALLAGLLKAPSRLNPIANPRAAMARARVVLGAMVETGAITQDEADESVRTKGIIAPPQRGSNNRYFTDWVIDQANRYIAVAGRDLQIRTTMSASIQGLAERHLTRMLTLYGRKYNVSQGAVVVMRPSGAVLALVGGASYARSQFNRATQARRQPGSTFKLFAAITALENGATPTTLYRDAPVRLGRWTPRNFRDRFYGEVTLRFAIARSLNSVAVRLVQQHGARRVARTARRMGIASPLRKDSTIALGTSEVSLLELTRAYAVLANGGRAVRPFGILDVRTLGGRRLFRRRERYPRRVLSETTTAHARELLRAVIDRGSGRKARLTHPAAGKTGTSQNAKDAWFVGYTRDLVIGVWVGNDDGTPMNGVLGGNLPALIWAAIMRDALDGSDPQPLR